MDNITRVLISQILRNFIIPEDHNYYEFHRVIQDLGLNLREPRVSRETLELLLKSEFEYAYIQVLINSVIPEGPASEFMEGAVRYRYEEDPYGNDGHYALELIPKKELLKKRDPEWVWKNKEALDEFMEDAWEPYIRTKQIIDNINSL